MCAVREGERERAAEMCANIIIMFVVKVLVTRGVHFQTMGHSVKGKLRLYAEEAVLLVDKGMMELYKVRRFTLILTLTLTRCLSLSVSLTLLGSRMGFLCPRNRPSRRFLDWLEFPLSATRRMLGLSDWVLLSGDVMPSGFWTRYREMQCVCVCVTD